MPRRWPARARCVALALVVALGVAGCGSSPAPAVSGSPTGAAPGVGSGSPAAGVQVISVTYANGVITPPEGRVVVPLGHRVEIRVTSDVAEIVHNHFNNQEQDVAAGGTVTFDFTADKPGVYEVELHKSDKLLLELQVQ